MHRFVEKVTTAERVAKRELEKDVEREMTIVEAIEGQ